MRNDKESPLTPPPSPQTGSSPHSAGRSHNPSPQPVPRHRFHVFPKIVILNMQLHSLFLPL